MLFIPDPDFPTNEEDIRMTTASKWYDTHLADFRKTAEINSMEMYRSLHKQSIEEPEVFWTEDEIVQINTKIVEKPKKVKEEKAIPQQEVPASTAT